VCKNSLTKKKFIWLFFDGLAFDELSYLFEKKKDSAVFYKVTADFFKQSGALHEIYLTGKFSRNFLAAKTQSDNLLYQINNSNYGIKYIGSEYPLYHLGGGKNSDPLQNFFEDNDLGRDIFPFYKICSSISESIFYPITFNYPLPEEFKELDFNKDELMKNLDLIYSKSLIKENIALCFDDAQVCCKQNPKNLIYYTQIIDSFNHGYSKEHPRTFSAAYAINQGILEIMEWINDNPDYVLILLSDHGGQAYLGEDNYCNHGCNIPGNEGVLFIYMKDFDVLKPVSAISGAKKISTFEVANIVAQVIENVNIPLESIGNIAKIVENSNIFK